MLFFFNDTATTEIYTLSLHDALPICLPALPGVGVEHRLVGLAADHRGERLLEDVGVEQAAGQPQDRKSTRLNSSHANISYAVFCLKKTMPQANSRTSHLARPAPPHSL